MSTLKNLGVPLPSIPSSTPRQFLSPFPSLPPRLRPRNHRTFPGPKPRSPRPGPWTRPAPSSPKQQTLGPAHEPTPEAQWRVGVSRARFAGQSASQSTRSCVGRTPVDRNVPFRRQVPRPRSPLPGDSPSLPQRGTTSSRRRLKPECSSRNPQTWPCVASGRPPRPSANHSGGGSAGPAPPRPLRVARSSRLRNCGSAR